MSDMVLNDSPAVSQANNAADIFEQPFPSRGAVRVLRDRIRIFIQWTRPAPGSSFWTDAELAERTGLSRSTIRRALQVLQREGWLSREVGRGTFVGPRARTGHPGHAVSSDVKTLRLGVVVFDIGGLADDWVTPKVMAGLDEAAETMDLSVELLGLREDDHASLTRRLERNRPDVLASLAAQPRDALLLRDAVRMNIPALVVGTAHQFMGFPAVVEDNRQGMDLALNVLRQAGHERIGMVINRWPAAWVFQRQEAFELHMLNKGLDPGRPGTCWIGSGDHPAYQKADESGAQSSRRSLMGGTSMPEAPPLRGAKQTLGRWMSDTRPTAVVAASYVALEMVAAAARDIGLAVPRDLSVVGLDQHPSAADWLGIEPTLAELPLRAMGREIAQAARALADGADMPRLVDVPFRLRPGASVGPPLTTGST